MERNEMIKILMEKTKVSYEEAEAVLQECDFDLLDAIIYLERQGKVENNGANTIIEVAVDNNEENEKENEKIIKRKVEALEKLLVEYLSL